MWHPISQHPPENVLLDTKIDDAQGVRNEAQLIRRGNLFFTSGPNSIYMYYTPTHWKVAG